jgi:uncharacterized protein YndB with AHSA1/START domain
MDQRAARELGDAPRPPWRIPCRERRRSAEGRQATSERSVEHATIIIERSYPASPERTFGAWADSEAKARWLGVPEGELELDFRVGGRERHQGTLPNGRVYTYQAVYQDIIRPRRILYTYEMLLDGRRISISLATAEFTPEGDGTRLVFTEQGAFLDGHEAPARRDTGMGSLLNALGKELQSEHASTQTTEGQPRRGDASA